MDEFTASQRVRERGFMKQTTRVSSSVSSTSSSYHPQSSVVGASLLVFPDGPIFRRHRDLNGGQGTIKDGDVGPGTWNGRKYNQNSLGHAYGSSRLIREKPAISKSRSASSNGKLFQNNQLLQYSHQHTTANCEDNNGERYRLINDLKKRLSDMTAERDSARKKCAELSEVQLRNRELELRLIGQQQLIDNLIEIFSREKFSETAKDEIMHPLRCLPNPNYSHSRILENTDQLSDSEYEPLTTRIQHSRQRYRQSKHKSIWLIRNNLTQRSIQVILQTKMKIARYLEASLFPNSNCKNIDSMSIRSLRSMIVDQQRVNSGVDLALFYAKFIMTLAFMALAILGTGPLTVQTDTNANRQNHTQFNAKLNMKSSEEEKQTR